MHNISLIPVEGVILVEVLVDWEVLIVEGVIVWVVPVADVVENGVVLGTGWVVNKVEVLVEPVGDVVLDNGFIVVPEIDEVILVSIRRWLSLSIHVGNSLCFNLYFSVHTILFKIDNFNKHNIQGGRL